jgi:hypothetical protein
MQKWALEEAIVGKIQTAVLSRKEQWFIFFV